MTGFTRFCNSICFPWIINPIMSTTALRVQTSPLHYSRLPANRKRWLAELSELIAFPSISAIPAHHKDIHAAARWLAQHLAQLGLRNAQVLPGANGGAPSVYADWLLHPHKPTLLIYGHFDVQPIDPVKAWATPPFQATLIGQNLYARGASDDKGQLFIHLKAIESYLKTFGQLPLNIKIWLEGEEEINSPNLAAFMDREQQRLRADAVLISDTEMIGSDCPSLIYGLRGSLTAELEVFGPLHDLHSGRFGGGVHNPIQALCEMLSTLHDRSGKIAIAGFYENVQESLHLAQVPGQCACCTLREQQLLKDLDIPVPWGEPGYSVKERMSSRPALIINGIAGGYTGPGAKAVLPSHSSAKFSFRLVPNQSPREIANLVKQHFAQITPPTVKTRLKIGGGSNPVLLPVQHPYMRAAKTAFQKSWGKTPAFTRSGGTIPVVEQLQKRLKAPIILMGFGLPNDDIHAPNEKMSLPQFYRGVETVIHFLAEAAAV
jgi:acetylornithine deacetylase/succinyl-diaminopimelate desuccinylase-like protein